MMSRGCCLPTLVRLATACSFGSMTVPDGGGGLDAGSDAGFDASPPIDGGGGPPDGHCVPVPPGRGAPMNVCSAAECIGLFATDVATNDLCAGEWFCEVETDCCLD